MSRHRALLARVILVALATTASVVSAPALAHEGPPFPIIVDEERGPFVVSVWTDPDIGIGTFHVVLEPRGERAMSTPDSIEVVVSPVSGRIPSATYAAEAQPVRYGARYYAEVAFDRGELWHVAIRIHHAGRTHELLAEVEATPDGTLGPIGLIVYLLPFLAVGFLWLKAFLRRRGTPIKPDEVQEGGASL